MDEMRLKISSTFMQRTISKLIRKVIFKKFGIQLELRINEMEAELKDGSIHFHVDADGRTTSDLPLRISKILEEEI